VKISFLIHNVFGIGGTNRAVINLAGELSNRHDVEIVSVFRRLEHSMMDIPARVLVTSLVDMRPGLPDLEDERQRQRSSVVPPHEELYSAYSQLTDDRVKDYLSRSRRDIYIGSRAALNIYLARWGPERAVLIAQEHQTHSTLPDGVRLVMQRSYDRLDAAVTVTNADARAFRELTPVDGMSLFSIPNSVPRPELPQAGGDARLVLSAGRLDEVKRYDILIHAFRGVVDVAPTWGLRIYGGGPESGRLAGLVGDLGLNNHVLLMGRQTQLQAEWAKGSVAVSTSDRESFGMSIVEAMRSGLPVVSTRAPVGPEEIITDGVDGLLTPVRDTQAITDALLSLIRDVPLRHRMAAAAVASSVRYDPQVVAARYEDVFEQLLLQKTGGHASPRRAVRSWRERGTQALKMISRARPSAQVDEVRKDFTGAAFLERSGAMVFELQASSSHGGIPVEVKLHDRNDRAGERAVTLPLTLMTSPTPTGGARWRATLPAETQLAESRWNVYTMESSGQSYRLHHAYCDLRHAAHVAVPAGAPLFSRRLPYGTADGFLALRSWLRGHHAECDSIEVADAHIIVVGRFMWPRAAQAGASLVARSRQMPDVEVLGVPLPAHNGDDFRFALPVDELATRRLTRHDSWDLYLQCPDVDSPVRLSRLADDVLERKAIYQYPGVRCRLAVTDLADEWPTPDVMARPYVTVDSDVSIDVRESSAP
jgi:glycosyltransferase involved in cell wall biosynthesis